MRNFLMIFSFLFIFHPFVTSDENSKPKIPKFAHEVEKIKPHANATFGTLKNGFRYVLLPNKTPEKRVAVYLQVLTGSLNETDKQLGLAHFLEHMAFNGTKNFPNNTLIDFFKQIGMDFGGDTNAYTSFDETVYMLNLPDEKYHEQAIKIMADYAMNMLLEPQEINKEREIILSEKRLRDSIKYRIYTQSLDFALPKNLIAKRMPIGKEEIIKTATQEDFLDYYHTWYRPEKMVLIVVGDIHTNTWEKNIKEGFKKFKNTFPTRPEYVLTEVEHKGLKVKNIYEKEAADTTVEISTIAVKKPLTLKYKELRKRQLAENAALYILDKRLEEKLTLKDTPYTAASVFVGTWLKEVHEASIEATCKPENWQAALSAINNELRQVLEFGVTDDELERFKKDNLNLLNVAVENRKTINSSEYVNQILSSISENTPFLDAVQKKKIEQPIIETLTKEDVLKEFKKYWTVEHRLILVSGNTEVKNPEDEVKKVLNESNQTELKEIKETKTAKFPFEAPITQKGIVKNKQEFKDLNFTRYTFENNVVLNLKQTQYKTNEINININIGNSSAGIPKDKPGIAQIADLAISEGGLTELSKTELEKALTGHIVSNRFSINHHYFTMQGSTTKTDFEINLQLARAILLYPGFREEASVAIKNKITQMANMLETNIQAFFMNSIRKIFFPTNQNFGSWPDKKELEKITLEDIKKWIEPQFKNGAIEITIVGDTTEKEALDLVAAYFGTLTKRQATSTPERKRSLIKEPINITEEFPTSITKTLICHMIPTTDYYNIEDTRYLNLLGNILNDKCNKLIREKLAISYSPQAMHYFNKDELDGSSLLFVALDIEPQNIDTYNNTVNQIIQEAVTNGITKKEFEDALKPLITQIHTTYQTNFFWLRNLSSSTTEPRDLEITKTFISFYENMTLEKLNEVAKKYLNLNKKSVYIVKPIPPQK